MAMIRADLLITRAAEVCTIAEDAIAWSDGADPAAPLSIVRDATVACRDGVVVWVGPADEAMSVLNPIAGCRTIDAAGCVVTPGLVDPHAHLPSWGSRAAEFAQRLAGVPYLEILAAGGGILHTVRATELATDEQLLRAGYSDLDVMLLGGVTTVEAKSGYGLSTEAELRLLRLAAELGRIHPVDVVPTFLGAHAVPPAFRGNTDGYVETILEQMLPAAKSQGVAEFCDVFCETGVFTPEQSRRILEKARDLELGLKLHADELSWSGGAELAGELGAVSADHLLFASPAGLEAMAAAGTVGVLLPVTVLSLLAEGVGVEHCRAQVVRMREAGVRLAVGTDYNPGTAPCRSLGLAISLACRIFGLTPAEAIVGVTRNAALALGRDRIGRIRAGHAADLAVFDVSSYAEIAYRIGDDQVRDVIKGGRIVVRDRAIGDERSGC